MSRSLGACAALSLGVLCLCTPVVGQCDVAFENPPLGTYLTPFDVFVTDGVEVTVWFYFLPLNPSICGPTIPTGLVEVTPDLCGSSGNSMTMWSSSLIFDFGSPVTLVDMCYFAYQQDLNLEINGECVSVSSLLELPSEIGGVTVTLTADSLLLDGFITSLRFGGSNVQIDCINYVLAQGFIRGDGDGDGIFNGLVDALYLLAHQFTGGPQPPCDESSDADGDGVFNGLLDSLYILDHQFAGGPAPPAPYPNCGVDPDPLGSLGCAITTCP